MITTQLNVSIEVTVDKCFFFSLGVSLLKFYFIATHLHAVTHDYLKLPFNDIQLSHGCHDNAGSDPSAMFQST
jgi:hypothetical protein